MPLEKIEEKREVITREVIIPGCYEYKCDCGHEDSWPEDYKKEWIEKYIKEHEDMCKKRKRILELKHRVMKSSSDNFFYCENAEDVDFLYEFGTFRRNDKTEEILTPMSYPTYKFQGPGWYLVRYIPPPIGYEDYDFKRDIISLKQIKHNIERTIEERQEGSRILKNFERGRINMDECFTCEFCGSYEYEEDREYHLIYCKDREFTKVRITQLKTSILPMSGKKYFWCENVDDVRYLHRFGDFSKEDLKFQEDVGPDEICSGNTFVEEYEMNFI
jgi:hypothetical protein